MNSQASSPDVSGAFALHDRTIAVIGAGSGIGEAVAHTAAGLGAHVVCLDVAAEGAARTADQIRARGAHADSSTVDIRDPEGVRAVLEAISHQHGALHGIVCTPGVNVRKPILDYAPDEFDRVVGVNLGGSFNVLQAAGRIMKAQGHGSIVLFASIRAQVVEPGQSVYAATKAGVIQLAKTAAAELSPAGVRINVIAPGVVETPLTGPIKSQPDWYGAYAQKNAMKRWAQPGEMAGPTVFLLTDAASYMTGSVTYVDGGWTAIDGRFQPPGM